MTEPGPPPARDAPFAERLRRYRSLTEAEMRAVLAASSDPPDPSDPLAPSVSGVASGEPPGEELRGWLRYHLGWEDEQGAAVTAPGGKLLRPAALLLACELVGGEAADAAPAAAAVELVHGFSLLHDDIEDRSERRRGRPTLWTRVGEAQAINAGDGMFVLARRAMHRLAAEHSPGRVVGAMRMLDDACWELVRGQHLDIAFETRAGVSPAEYLDMAAGKTAAMFAAPFAIGALLGGAPRAAVRGFSAFGHHTGLAFQAIDDVLGIWGDPASTGKPVGDDLRTRKMTYPVVSAAAATDRPEQAAALRRAYADPAATVEALTALVEAAGGREATEALARREQEAALAALRESGLAAEALDLARAFTEAAVLRVA